MTKEAMLEKALEMACDFIHSQDVCPIVDCKLCSNNEEGGDPECYGNGCNENLAEYFKSKAGIEVCKDDE